MSSAADKKAQFEVIMAKKRAMQTSNSVAARPTAVRASAATNDSVRAQCEVTIVGTPRTGDGGSIYVEGLVLNVTDGGGEGKMMVPFTPKDAAFHCAPLTDAKGGYTYKFDNRKRTDERKPFALGEFGYAVLKLGSPPKFLDGFTSPQLYPGMTITVEKVAISSVYKCGVQLSGTYVLGSAKPAFELSCTPLDLEAPHLSFRVVLESMRVTHRNMMLSTVMGGYWASWERIKPTNTTKQFVRTLQLNERDALLKNDGVWTTSMRAVANEGDGSWKSDLESLVQRMVEAAPYCQDGLGFDCYNGPKVVMPIFGLSREQALEANMPSEYGQVCEVLDSDTPSEGCLFEGAVTLRPESESLFFGAPFNSRQQEQGGPWMNLAVNAYTVAKGSFDVVSLEDPILVKVPILSLPSHLGSKHVETLKAVAQAFLPLTNLVASFEPILKNVKENPKSVHMWANLTTVDFHAALLENGIEVDEAMVLELFNDDNINAEETDVAKQFSSQPKRFLASGFVLLNESLDARKEGWLDSQLTAMEKILEQKGRPAGQQSCTIEMRAIDPRGFEEHKATYSKLEGMELQERIAEIERDWPVYAVLKIEGPSAKLTKKTPVAAAGPSSSTRTLPKRAISPSDGPTLAPVAEGGKKKKKKPA